MTSLRASRLAILVAVATRRYRGDHLIAARDDGARWTAADSDRRFSYLHLCGDTWSAIFQRGSWHFDEGTPAHVRRLASLTARLGLSWNATFRRRAWVAPGRRA